MLAALGAVSSVLDALQTLASSKSSSSSAGQQPAGPFDVTENATGSAGATSPQPSSGFSQISPQTMSALIAAQGEAGTNAAPANPSDALKDLFSQIDADADGSITKTEFENALGAGGTNTTAAGKVFGELDTNGDGSVSLDEMKSALQGAGGHHGHGHHMHAHAAGGSGGSDGSDPGSDPLLQALSGASSTSVSNSDGSTTTSITYADGSKVSLTTPAASTTSSANSGATSSYNLIEQFIQREAQALSASAAASLSMSV
jgi:Ca2+-binding EF-hand superfamily protein